MVLAFLGAVLAYLVIVDPQGLHGAGVFLSIVFMLVGLYCLCLSGRLLFANSRTNAAGLFSPFALKTGAIAFVALPSGLFLLRADWLMLANLGFFLACSVACWSLAVVRQNQMRNERGRDRQAS